jgi:WD40 repeat protein
MNDEDAILSLDWSSDGEKIVAGGYGIITVWNVQSAEVIQTITTEGIVTNVSFSPDGEHIYHTLGPAGIYRDGLPLQEAIAADQSE